MDSGKAEGRKAGPVADEESSVESGREVPAGGQEDIAEVRRIGPQKFRRRPEDYRRRILKWLVCQDPPEDKGPRQRGFAETVRHSPTACPRGIEEESINRSAYRIHKRLALTEIRRRVRDHERGRPLSGPQVFRIR